MSGEPIPLPQPTPDERKMAMLAHVLQLFGGFIAPLVIFLVKPESKFVRFHALQPLIWQIIVIILSMFLVFGLMTAMFLTIPFEQPPKHGPPPLGFFLMFGGSWFFMMIHWVINLIFAIYFGIKAYDGAWARYPLIGRLAAAWSGI